MDAGALVGIIVGSVLGFILIVFLCVYIKTKGGTRFLREKFGGYGRVGQVQAFSPQPPQIQNENKTSYPQESQWGQNEQGYPASNGLVVDPQPSADSTTPVITNGFVQSDYTTNVMVNNGFKQADYTTPMTNPVYVQPQSQNYPNY